MTDSLDGETFGHLEPAGTTFGDVMRELASEADAVDALEIAAVLIEAEEVNAAESANVAGKEATTNA